MENILSISKKVDLNLRAPKLSGTGAVYYSIWVDTNGVEYVKVEKVVGGSGVGNGTFSSDVYRVDAIATSSEITGYDLSSGAARVTQDNNMSGFLRAIKADVEKRREDEQ